MQTRTRVCVGVHRLQRDRRTLPLSLPRLPRSTFQPHLHPLPRERLQRHPPPSSPLIWMGADKRAGSSARRIFGGGRGDEPEAKEREKKERRCQKPGPIRKRLMTYINPPLSASRKRWKRSEKEDGAEARGAFYHLGFRDSMVVDYSSFSSIYPHPPASSTAECLEGRVAPP